MILYATSDLLWASRISSAAKARSVKARPLAYDATDDQILAAAPDALIVELDGSAAPIELIRRVRDAGASPTIVAFGPHVDEASLAGASAAGADEVLTRGAAMRSMEDLVGRLASGD